MKSQGLSKYKKHNVEARREQQLKGHVLLLAMAMAPVKQQGP